MSVNPRLSSLLLNDSGKAYPFSNQKVAITVFFSVFIFFIDTDHYITGQTPISADQRDEEIQGEKGEKYRNRQRKREADIGTGRPKERDMRGADMLWRRGGGLTIEITSLCFSTLLSCCVLRDKVWLLTVEVLRFFLSRKNSTKSNMQKCVSLNFLHSLQQLWKLFLFWVKQCTQWLCETIDDSQ